MKAFYKLKDYLLLRKAKKEADRQLMLNGERNFVIPTGNGQLLVLGKNNFRRLKAKKQIAPDLKIADLIQMCFYHTPHRSGKDGMSKEFEEQRKALYYDWCNQWREIRKKQRKMKKS